jgi:hypothetical protein
MHGHDFMSVLSQHEQSAMAVTLGVVAGTDDDDAFHTHDF